MPGLGYREKIEDVGLRKYINKTMYIHNNHGYKHFVNYLNDGLNDTAIAKIFKVDRRTAKKWREIYDKEQGK